MNLFNVIKKTFIPLLSLFIFAMGSGFFVTLIALAMNRSHEKPILIGAISGCYYIGLVVGSYKIESFIARVGHIRAFSTFASTLAVVCLGHGMIYNMPIWFLLRFIGGFSTAGLFVVIESWLLCNSTNKTRGQILSLYMVTFYVSEALGQLFLNLASPKELLLYAIAAMLCSLSVIPLSMTKTPLPQFDEPSNMLLKDLYHKTKSGFFGCFLAGMLLSVTYALLPILFSNLYNHNAAKVSYLMFCLIGGSIILQYPIGKLSDIIERRLVLIGVCLFIIISSILLLFSNNYLSTILLITIFGGLSTTIYPICISHSCDSLSAKDIVAGIQGLLLAYSIGAALGPFIAPISMHILEGKGVFLYFIIIALILTAIFTWRKTQKDSPPQEEPFQIMTQTTPIIAGIDPRAE